VLALLVEPVEHPVHERMEEVERAHDEVEHDPEMVAMSDMRQLVEQREPQPVVGEAGGVAPRCRAAGSR
jgi:hypothetical protein